MIGISEQEKSDLAVAMFHPLKFTLAKSEAEDAWGRAQSFIGRFSSMKIQTATDYVIQTYNPVGSGINFGYYITKTPLGDEVEIEVQCPTDNMFSGKDADINAHIAALYIDTGMLVCQRCISR
jgi:hypothetical protein